MRRLVRPPKAPASAKESARREFYLSPEWRAIRKEVFKKYGRTCMRCGYRTGVRKQIHVDHIQPISKRPDLKLDFNNLQVLCKRCNQDKGSKHATDYRHTRAAKREPTWFSNFSQEEITIAMDAVKAHRSAKVLK